MNIDLGNGLARLALLSGPGGAFASPAARIESRAVRLAKAQFTLPVVQAPWQSPSSAENSISAIRRMTSIVDRPGKSNSLPPDVQAAFTTYKALDRLRALAEWSARSASSSAERASLQESFTKGLTDLRDYLAGASSDVLTLAFDQPSRRGESIALPTAASLEVRGKGVTASRYGGLAGLTGTERFTLKLSRSGEADSVTIDLSRMNQPPTLDRIAEALNSAIAAVPRLGADGSVLTDADGKPVSKWASSFSVVKSSGGWGLQLNGGPLEAVSIVDEGAGDALMIAAGHGSFGAAPSTAVMRLDLSDGALNRTNLADIGAIDRQATAEAQTVKSGATVAASFRSQAVAVGADGCTYVVGTSRGDVAGSIGDGADDLILSKLDGSGAVLWQRSLGTAGSATGAALSIAADGDIIVAGTATGDVDGASSDGDMLVARFSASGDEEFLTLVRAAGADRASAVAVAADGGIVVGGRGGSGDGDAFLARLDAGGKLVERRLIDGGAGASVRALRTAPDGSLVALTVEGGSAVLRRIGTSLAENRAMADLGTIDAASLAIAADGRIAVGGSRDRDGYVAVLDSSFAMISEAALATSGSDQIDSIGWAGSQLYAGGRTSGMLGSSKSGTVDGFVAEINPWNGEQMRVHQWGRAGERVEPVSIAAAPGADNRLGAIGFASGVLNPRESSNLVANTSLRAGDRFSIRVDGGTTREIRIEEEDTMATLATRLSRIIGRSGSALTAKAGDGSLLRIEAKSGHTLQLIAGPEGRDALAKLGMQPLRLTASPPPAAKAPRVRPGGSYGLELSTGLNLRDRRSAALALGKLKSAISVTQTAFRSLYWDETKEALVNGSGAGSGSVSPYLAGQLARYQDALSRLGGTAPFNPGA